MPIGRIDSYDPKTRRGTIRTFRAEWRAGATSLPVILIPFRRDAGPRESVDLKPEVRVSFEHDPAKKIVTSFRLID